MPMRVKATGGGAFKYAEVRSLLIIIFDSAIITLLPYRLLTLSLSPFFSLLKTEI
jgi:hypothetical protein